MSDFTWESPALSPEEQKLVDAYVGLGRSVDDLAYSEEFEKLCDRLYGDHSRETMRVAFLQLLRLRKQARLPRPSAVSY